MTSLRVQNDNDRGCQQLVVGIREELMKASDVLSRYHTWNTRRRNPGEQHRISAEWKLFWRLTFKLFLLGVVAIAGLQVAREFLVHSGWAL